jgi:hypothetical protein
MDCYARAGSTQRAVDLFADLRDAADAVASDLSRILVDLIAAKVFDDVDAAREGLALVLEHSHRRYEAEFHLQLGRLGIDPEANLTRAHRGWDVLGAVEGLDAVEAAMRRHGVRVPTRRGTDRFALSHAERRVAELVGEGLTNRAIAERLAYSVKTSRPTCRASTPRRHAPTGSSSPAISPPRLNRPATDREERSVDHTTPASPLPQPSGPHAVGRVSHDWVDASRRDFYAQDPAARRRLVVWIWYPAISNDAERADYLPEPWAPTAQFLGLDVRGLRTHAVEDAPVSDAHRATPCSSSRPAGSRRSSSRPSPRSWRVTATSSRV